MMLCDLGLILFVSDWLLVGIEDCGYADCVGIGAD